jgi:hypothetical protein
MDTTDKKCPDCGQPMKAIRIMDIGSSGYRAAQGEMYYMAPEAKRSFWTGRLPVEGKIVACMCDACGRILLYGEPRSE